MLNTFTLNVAIESINSVLDDVHEEIDELRNEIDEIEERWQFDEDISEDDDQIRDEAMAELLDLERQSELLYLALDNLRAEMEEIYHVR
jgi:chromosome segregation ATPase